MHRKIFLSLGSAVMLSCFSVAGGVVMPVGHTVAPSSGLTIPQALLHVINKNPEIRQRIENYRAVEQDRTIAFSGHLPVVDVQAGIGNMRYNDSSVASGDDWTHTEAFIRARQNIFHGFGIQNDVLQQDKRLLSAKYAIMEKVSQLGLEMVDTFLAILKAKKILKLSIENHNVHKEYYSKIKEVTTSGAGSQGDMDQISGRMALSQSNVIVAQNNLLDAETNFLRIYGYGLLSSPVKLKETNVNTGLIPGSLEQADELAERQYPSYLAVQNNVKCSA